jgi:hypothetical protein
MRRRPLSRAAIAAALVLCLVAAGGARAADAGVVGTSVTVSRSASGKQVLKSLQRGAGVAFGPASAASELAGRFELFYVDVPANRATLDLPAPWASNTGLVATYRNPQAPDGPSPVKVAQVKAGTLAKLTAASIGRLDLTAPPGAGGVLTVLTITNAGDGSTHRMCSLYRVDRGSRVQHRAVNGSYKLVLKKGVPAPCPTCTDGVQNGSETGVDCGGGSGCGACPAGQGCADAGDCQSGICTAGVCQAPSCTDQLRDGNETDVDCGGACPACADGGACATAADCASRICSGGVCQAPTCSDAVRNGDELDVDCGGTRCPACVPFTVTIDAPVLGVFSLASSVAVQGHTTGVGVAGADLTINGTPVALAGDGTFATAVALSPAPVFNPIAARLVRHGDGRTAYDRVVVIAGKSIADGAPSPDGVAMRINDAGLDSIEPVATSLVAIDPATLVTPGTTVMSDYCYAPLGSLCLGSVDVAISGTPPPALGPVGIALDAQPGAVHGDISLHDLRVTVDIDNASGIPLHCELHLTVPLTTLRGDYALSPLAPEPTQVDVAQVGDVSVQATGTTYTSDCSGLLGDLEESLIGSAIGDVGALFANGMQQFLNQVDAHGNTPIAGAIESALAGVDIAGPVGAGLGIDLHAPFTAIDEDASGITFAADVAATTLVPDPSAPDLAASYHVDEAFPTFGVATPVQGLPYGLGFAISTSGFNQLLRAQIESGLLRSTLTSIDLGSGPLPVTAGLLAAAFPPFGGLPASTPIAIRIRPTLAPVLTGNTGPAGELAEIRMAQLRVEFVERDGAPDETVLLALAVDARVGLQLAFQPGGIGFVISPPAGSDVTVALLANPLQVDEAALQAFVPGVVASFLPQIAGALASFPLPSFLGLSLSGVEVARAGQYYGIFADLTPACTSGATCPSGVCLAGTCQAPSCTDGTRNGSETAADCGGGSCPGCATGQGCFLDADCAVGGCSGGLCQPPCTSGGECPSGVCTGGYCRVPNCADHVRNGTETDVDCGGGAPSCVRCADGAACAVDGDCASAICRGGVCQAPSCTDGMRNGAETDVDCGGPTCPACALQQHCDAATDCATGVCSNTRCTCGDQLLTFTVTSSNGGVFSSAQWPGGTALQAGPAGCSVTVNLPNDNVDKVCTLASPFSVRSFTGWSQCFGSGGEDGDGCQPVSCPPAGIGSCCSTRPSCSAALNGSAQARYFVQCLE